MANETSWLSTSEHGEKPSQRFIVSGRSQIMIDLGYRLKDVIYTYNISNIVDSAEICLGHFLRTHRIEYPPTVVNIFPPVSILTDQALESSLTAPLGKQRTEAMGRRVRPLSLGDGHVSEGKVRDR